MGGKDIYSGSKGAAELVIKSYVHSFFNNEKSPVKIGIGRAGNVIGGGDWAADRIVVDCMKNWNSGKTVEIRSPKATRPWQHVLEPLSGYLSLGANIFLNNNLHGEAFNFGPRAEQNHTVVDLLMDLSKYWGIENSQMAYKITDEIPFHEAGLLKLNCDKALFYLKWQSTLEYSETIKLIAEWYLFYFNKEKDMFSKTILQILEYENFAIKRSNSWTKHLNNE
jgi:CDP-glucose 4,6-dehydratase